jgi:hypothetical protein
MESFKSYVEKHTPKLVQKLHHPDKTNYNLYAKGNGSHHIKDTHGEVLHTFKNMSAKEIVTSLKGLGFKEGHHDKFHK